MSRLLKILLTILVFSTLSFTNQSTSYLNDSLNMGAHVFIESAASYQKQSFINSNAEFNSNSTAATTQKSMVLTEFNVGIQNEETPYIVSVNVEPDWVLYGNTVTIDILLNEVIRTANVKIDGLRLAYTYANQHIYALFQPTEFFDRIVDLELIITDMGGNIGEDSVTLSLYVDNGNKKLLASTVSDEMPHETHIGKQKATGLAFTLMRIEKENVFEGLVLTVNAPANEIENIFDTIYLYEASSNLLLAQTSTLAPEIYLALNTENIIGLSPEKYYIKYDITDLAAVSISHTLSISEFRTHHITGNQKQLITTSSIENKNICTVAKSKPIIAVAQIPEYIGTANELEPEIIYEIAQNTVSQIRHRIYNLDTLSSTTWNTTSYTSTATSINNQYRMSNNSFTGLALTHNNRYRFEFELIGSLTSVIITTNECLVDTTPPTQPGDLTVRLAQSAQSSNTHKMATENTVKIALDFTAPQSLDAESGISAYKILKKSANSPYWEVGVSANIEKTTNNAYTAYIDETLNNLYFYKLTVQNKAKVWSVASKITDYNLGGAATIISQVFNNPNPFDSRVDNTTIYYTLNADADVEAYIYDMFGYLVKKWSFAAGFDGGKTDNSIVWDGCNLYGDKVSKGGYVFILKATTNGITMTKKYKIGVIH